MSVNAHAIPGPTGPTLRSLRDDEGGAVMLIGLLMACFLIGSLWFLIGIGDAIVFRDTMQEAADHTAFTSAALHAKGMNFISACNIVLLALVAIHILLGIVHDVMLVACVVSLFFGGEACPPYFNVRKVYTGYFKFLKIAGKSIHLLEVAAADGYPYIGLIRGRQVGSEYGKAGVTKRDLNVLAISTSLIPGNSLVSTVDKAFKTTTNAENKKLGLPVEARQMNDLCKKLIQTLGDKLTAGADFGPFNILSKGIEWRYCNSTAPSGIIKWLLEKAVGKATSSAKDEDDAKKQAEEESKKVDLTKEKDKDKGKDKGFSLDIDPGFNAFWGKDGPLVPWGGTKNGSPWQQVWAVNLQPKFKDSSEHSVAIASGKLGLQPVSKARTYFAQAEFYFDCKDNWAEADCDKDDNAGYVIGWRARMRKLQAPEALSTIGAMNGKIQAGLQQYENIKDSVTNVTDHLGPIGDAIDGMFSKLDTAADTIGHTSDTIQSLGISKPYH